jgi:DNA-binding NarL/FixJ family response regulator
MRKINVLLAIRPRMLAAVVSHLVARQPDMEVVSEVMHLSELGAAIRATSAEVVILTPADADQEVELCRQLWAQAPHLKIMSLSATGDTAHVYRSGAPTKRIADVSEASILSAIREFRW